jgi:hypothetical protein
MGRQITLEESIKECEEEQRKENDRREKEASEKN